MQLQNNILKRDNIDSYALVLKSSTQDHYYQLAYGWADETHPLCIGFFRTVNYSILHFDASLFDVHASQIHYRFKGVAPLRELISTREASLSAFTSNSPKVMFFNVKGEAVCIVNVTEDTFEEILRQHLSNWI